MEDKLIADFAGDDTAVSNTVSPASASDSSGWPSSRSSFGIIAAAASARDAFAAVAPFSERATIPFAPPRAGTAPSTGVGRRYAFHAFMARMITTVYATSAPPMVRIPSCDSAGAGTGGGDGCLLLSPDACAAARSPPAERAANAPSYE
eukprot:4551752-Prymnesium_polylepis.1